MRLAAIDPGYSTAGIVVASVQPNAPPEIVRVCAAKSEPPEDTSNVQIMQERCWEFAGLLVQHLGDQPIAAVILENPVSGGMRQNPMTLYYRGFFDSALQSILLSRGVKIHRIAPYKVKQFAHPTGKAVDRGRRGATEVAMALNQLIPTLHPRDFQKITQPEIVRLGAQIKRWKHAYLHTLDAAVMLAALLVAYNVPSSCAGELKSWQTEIARAVL